MRRVTLEIEINGELRRFIEPFMRHVEEVEMVDILRLDLMNGIKVGVVRFKLAEGSTFEDILEIGYFKVIEMIEDRGREKVCLIKATAPPGFDDLRQKADLDLKMVPPMRMTRDGITFSFIGDEDQIAKMMDVLKTMGAVYKIGIHRAAFENSDLLSVLTERQKELVITAKRLGYYQYPREANAEDVAMVVGLSTSTVVEHLRKSEIRLMDVMLAGYTY
ncbi:MAG: HTH DNA binding domain protein [Methanomassiliicoccales archaeon PtaU1.Bin124]|nr:MAG: HTH DNA binding domain protein [Methanomassiliicoccales archaeon PtaU1.Bin124]